MMQQEVIITMLMVITDLVITDALIDDRAS
jgi:hypothetical protein